jgi:hypothetical protein
MALFSPIPSDLAREIQALGAVVRAQAATIEGLQQQLAEERVERNALFELLSEQVAHASALLLSISAFARQAQDERRRDVEQASRPIILLAETAYPPS